MALNTQRINKEFVFTLSVIWNPMRILKRAINHLQLN
jgi:hypothetical protein